MTPAQQPELYALTRWGLEEYYDALAHINGKAYADRMWERVERDTRSRPHTTAPENVETFKSAERYAKSIIDHDAAIARAATLAERKRILRIIENIIVIYGTSTRTSAERINEYVCKELQSLRRTAQEQP